MASSKGGSKLDYRDCLYFSLFEVSSTAYAAYSEPNQIKSNQIKIYIAPYVHEDSEALGGWITCSRRVGIDEFLNVFERQ